jgi:anti-anti-sigma regulatory factor
MNARVHQFGEVTVISIFGPLTIDCTQPFRQAVLKRYRGQKIVFNMSQAAFVGSTGISDFVETLRELGKEHNLGVKVAGPKMEFKRILQNLELQKLEIFDSESLAINSFHLPNAELRVTAGTESFSVRSASGSIPNSFSQEPPSGT